MTGYCPDCGCTQCMCDYEHEPLPPKKTTTLVTISKKAYESMLRNRNLELESLTTQLEAKDALLKEATKLIGEIREVIEKENETWENQAINWVAGHIDSLYKKLTKPEVQ